MPWVVKECGRRGADGAGGETILVFGCVTRVPHSMRRIAVLNTLYRVDPADCQKRCGCASPHRSSSSDERTCAHSGGARLSARVSKDGREFNRCVHPSRRLLRKLLRIRTPTLFSKSKPLSACPGTAC